MDTEKSKPSLRDVIDTALSEVEEDTSIDNLEDAPTLEADEEATPSDLDTPEKEEEGTEEVLESTKEGRERDEKGRFRKRELETPPSGELEKESSQSQEESPLEPPRFWKGEWKALFTKAPKELQGVILERERERDQYISRLHGAIGHHQQAYKEIQDRAAPYAYLLEKYETPLPEAVERLLGWQHELESDPVNGIRRLAESYGLGPNELINGIPPQRDGLSAREEQLTYELERLKAEQQAKERDAQSRELYGLVDTFAKETDAQGNLLRPYFDALRPQIAATVKVLEQKAPQASGREILQVAYDAVVEDVKKLFPDPSKSKDIEAIDRRTQAAKKAASSLKNEPSSGAPREKKIGWREGLKKALTTVELED